MDQDQHGAAQRLGAARPTARWQGTARALADAHLHRGAGRLLFLPPYSPDLNPIEQVFAKLKAALRKAQERTATQVITRIGAMLPTFPPDECANYFTNSGYASM